MAIRPQDDPHGLTLLINTATPGAIRTALLAVVDELLCAPQDRDYRSAHTGTDTTEADQAVDGIIADISCAIRIALRHGEPFPDPEARPRG